MKAPLYVNGTPVWAVVDTGATASVISGQEARRLNVRITETRVRVRLGNGQEALGLEARDVALRLGDRMSNARVIILEELPVPMILGLADLAPLGIALQGIPARHTDEQDPGIGTENFDFARVEWDMSHQVPKAELTQIMNIVAEELEKNECLTGRATHAAATVRIETLRDEPAYTPQYGLSRSEAEAVRMQVKEWLRLGVVEPSVGSRWNHAFICVPKKDAEGRPTLLRVCLDVRKLNTALRRPSNNLPRIPEILERVMTATIFTELDLVAGYNQMTIHPDSRDLLTFTVDGQRYRFVGAPFGVATLPELFQQMMTMILDEAGCSQFAVAYLDNVYVMSSSAEEHAQHLRRVIAALTKAGLQIGLEKSHIAYEQGIVLGHEVGGSRRGSFRRPSALKMEKVLRLPIPTTGKQVAAILGFLNYLREYIPCYSRIAAPLEAVRKCKKIRPTPEVVGAIRAFQHLLVSAPLLEAPNFEYPFEVETDASGLGVGAALYQDYDGRRHYIRFAASSLQECQRAYSVTVRELVAAIFALKAFREFLHGSRFRLYSDHRALAFLFSTREASPHLRRYAAEILEYDFEIVHKPGLSIPLPDALSRMYPPTAVDDDSVFLLSEECNLFLASEVATPTDIQSIVRAASELQWLEEGDPYKAELMTECHRQAHEGPRALVRRVLSRGFVWKGLWRDAVAHVENCASCLRYNVRRAGFHPLSPVMASLPWEHVALDLWTIGVTSERGHTYTLVVTDVCTRYVLLRPLVSKTAAAVAKELLDIFGSLGIPLVMQMDNGREFDNEVMQRVCTGLGVHSRFISPYHPQANSAAESYVRLSKQQLMKLMEGQVHRWCELLPSIQLNLNTRTSRRHGSSPFALFFGRQLKWSRSLTGEAPKPPIDLEELQKHYQDLYDVVMPVINEQTKEYNEKMVRAWNKTHKTARFAVGTYVMVKDMRRTKKTDPIYKGPYRIVEASSKGTYRLLDATGDLVPRAVPPSQLRVIAEPEAQSYEVEAILNHQGEGDQLRYKVRWKGFDESHDTWEPPSVFNATDCIAEYWRAKAKLGRNPVGHSSSGISG